MIFAIFALSMTLFFPSASIGAATAGSAWTVVPASDAQCTFGAKTEQHFAKIRISTFTPRSSFKLEVLPRPAADEVKNSVKSHPKALFIGNGPIFLENGKPGGYVKSMGKILSPLDCSRYRMSHQNLGKENSVFLRYHPRKLGNDPENAEAPWKYRVISSDSLCSILRPSSKAHQVADDLAEEDQIDFAIQSGPGVLRDGKNLLSGYNSATRFRSYIGVNDQGEPVVVEADGFIGSYCLGQYLLKQGIRDLLHRDSSVCDAVYREANGAMTTYPTGNPNARAASLLIISK